MPLQVSERRHKKYKMVFTTPRKTVHFGDTRYMHYKDNTSLKKYTHLNHKDTKRRKLFWKRMAGANTKKQALATLDSRSAAFLSVKYLW